MMSDVKSKDKSHGEGPGGSALGVDIDVNNSGYIIEDGNLIPIDNIALEALNKFAYDAIKVQVKDHFE